MTVEYASSSTYTITIIPFMRVSVIFRFFAEQTGSISGTNEECEKGSPSFRTGVDATWPRGICQGWVFSGARGSRFNHMSTKRHGGRTSSAELHQPNFTSRTSRQPNFIIRQTQSRPARTTPTFSEYPPCHRHIQRIRTVLTPHSANPHRATPTFPCFCCVITKSRQ